MDYENDEFDEFDDGYEEDYGNSSKTSKKSTPKKKENDNSGDKNNNSKKTEEKNKPSGGDKPEKDSKSGIEGIKDKLTGGIGGAKENAKDAAKKVAKDAAKEAAKAALKVAKLIIKLIPLPIKIAIAVVILVIIVAAVVIMIFKSTDSTAQKMDTVTTSYEEQLKNGNMSEEEKKQLSNALDLYNKNGVFVGFTLDQLNTYYDGAVEETRESFPAISKSYRSEYGDIKKSEQISYNDKLPLYQHVLRLEKYNFNKIKWLSYSHTSDGAEINDSQKKYDASLGLKYPNDGKTEIVNLLKLTSPYLFNWRFPLAMINSRSYQDQNESKIGSTAFEVQTGLAAKKYNTLGDFAYQIIKYGQSDITVNQYAIESCTLNTEYEIYKEVKARDSIEVSYRKKYVKNDKGELVLVFDGGTTVVNYINGNANVAERLENAQEIDTRKNANGDIDVNLEKVVGDYEYSKEYSYFVSYALAYDTKKQNDFNYSKFNYSDVYNRINEKVKFEKDPVSYSGVIEADQYKKYNESGVDSSKTPSEIANLYGGILGNEAIKSRNYSDDEENLEGKTITYTTVILTGEYVYREGNNHYVVRTWNDELTPMSSKTESVSYQDVLDFNDNDEADVDKETVTKETFEQETMDVEYYESLSKDEDINTIDLLNSNPKIISKYLTNGQKTSKYIGYSKSDLTISQGVKNVTKLLKDFAGDGSLPFVYGKSLGFAVQGTDIGRYTSGMNLLKEYIRSRESHTGLADENGNPVTTLADAKYYRVGLVGGNRTVGYGIDLDAGGKEEEIKKASGLSVINAGDLIEIAIVDAAEDEVLKGFYDKMKGFTSELELPEYQLHAMVSRAYNCGPGSLSGTGTSTGAIGIRNGLNFIQAYNTLWNKETDDLYETLYEQYKSAESSSGSAIKGQVNYENALYKDYMSSPTNPGTSVEQGLINRRKSEWTLFSTGYYDSLSRFWSRGGFASAFGLELNNSDGSANEENLLKLQAYFEENVFANIIHTESTVSWKSFTLPSQYNEYYVSIVQGKFFQRYGNSGHTGPSGFLFQCPWWALARASTYLYERDPVRFANGLGGGMGNGDSCAINVAKTYNLPLETDSYNIRPNSIISMVNGGAYGHVAYVEAVDYVNGYYYVSHCGSGKSWYGVTKHKLGAGTDSSSRVTGVVCLDDLF